MDSRTALLNFLLILIATINPTADPDKVPSAMNKLIKYQLGPLYKNSGWKSQGTRIVYAKARGYFDEECKYFKRNRSDLVVVINLRVLIS